MPEHAIARINVNGVLYTPATRGRLLIASIAPLMERIQSGRGLGNIGAITSSIAQQTLMAARESRPFYVSRSKLVRGKNGNPRENGTNDGKMPCWFPCMLVEPPVSESEAAEERKALEDSFGGGCAHPWLENKIITTVGFDGGSVNFVGKDGPVFFAEIKESCEFGDVLKNGIGVLERTGIQTGRDAWVAVAAGDIVIGYEGGQSVAGPLIVPAFYEPLRGKVSTLPQAPQKCQIILEAGAVALVSGAIRSSFF
ncbi:Uncharacterised protein [Candidatus Anstonella stagnisolia]|nr:Uncharacterised protein [Candidatus Anstonella stagnisolia]